MTRTFGALAILLTLSGTGLGGADDARARALDAKLIAPCCFSQQVSLHQSPAADDVRLDVRRRIAAGETDEQIIEAYVAQYGNRILAEPPARGFGRWLYVSPVLAFVLSAGALVLVVRRISARRASQPAAAPVATGAAAGVSNYEEALADQLRDMD